MATGPARKLGRKKKEPVTRRQVQGSKYICEIIELLKPLHSHCDCHNRKLHYDEYVAYLLLYFFTPVIDSLGGLQQVSELGIVKKRFRLNRFSMGSFSESGRVFDPCLLEPIIEHLFGKLGNIHPDERLADLELNPVAFDGSLLHALPKMVWALWLDEEHRAAKMHLQFNLLKGAPQKAILTAANAQERRVLAEHLTKGMLYVLDRGYEDFQLMCEIINAGSSFVMRVRTTINPTIIERRPISDQARKAGVYQDSIVHLGSRNHPEVRDVPLRLIKIRARRPAPRGETKGRRRRARADSDEHYEDIHIVTDLLDLDVELTATMYKYRWEVELFFRWFKKILKADKLLSLSKNGLTIIMYCALIASVLVVLWTGCKPTKRTFEMICLFFLGVATADELARHISKLEKIEQ